jgi:hypothetical protein
MSKLKILDSLKSRLFVKPKIENITRFNLFLGAIFALYVLCASKYIGHKDSIFYSNFYKLVLLVGVLVIYPYNKQAGVILLIIVMVTHLPIFREKIEAFISATPETGNGTGNGNVLPTLSPNKLESRESNFDLTIEKRKGIDKKVENEKPRMDLLREEKIITPLEQKIISEIQRNYDDEIDIITTDDFEKISKYTDEGNPIDAGLLPKAIDIKASGIDYSDLIKAGKVIEL